MRTNRTTLYTILFVFLITPLLGETSTPSIDNKMIKEKKIYPMGKKIFNKICNKDIRPQDYISIVELESAIVSQKLCKRLKKKQLHAVSLYLWDVKRLGELNNTQEIIKVTKDEKCPICGMFVYKYPRWVGQIFYADMHYSFDGVKDLMKYYFSKENQKSVTKIEKILVTDYYSQKSIDAKKAYFVMGSDIYGPMGDELIPFANKDDAQTFYMDHRAKKIVRFQEIQENEVYKLDE